MGGIKNIDMKKIILILSIMYLPFLSGQDLLMKDKYVNAQVLVNPYRFAGFQIPTDSLLAYYPFNGNANDESGNGRNGTVSGPTLTTGKDGDANSAYLWSAANDVITAACPVQSGTSVSVWLNESSTPDNFDAVFRLYKGGGGYVDVIFISSAWNLRINEASNQKQWSFLSSLPSGWNHYVFTYTNTDMKLYLNGVEQSVISKVIDNTVSLVTGSSTLYIGNSVTTGRAFNGSQDQLRIYNKILTQEEITALSNE